MSSGAITDHTISSKHSAYKLHGDARKQYDTTLLELTRVVKFWPPIPQVRAAAQKWPTISILDTVAAANGWQRPKTVALTIGDVIPPGTVLKQSHSDRGDSVILPPESVVGDDAAARRERRRLTRLRSWNELAQRTYFEEQTWVSQDYVETLTTLGEWRCFIVGGHIASVVHTIHEPHSDREGKRVWQFRSLREIR